MELDRRDVVPELEALVTGHPLDESLVALLMRALRHNGAPGRALQVYEAARRRLADQLGVDPSAELAALHLELLRDGAPPARGNLPAEVSSFVGRESDVREVRELIAAHRLVTLIGPGGSGKTRLSVEVGGRMPGEVWRVELAPVTDPAEVPQALLSALRLRSQVLIARPGRASAAVESVPPLQRLREAVAGRAMLLILDNCEHLIAAAAEVADVLLRAAPGLRLVTTSREPLGIAGERLYPVEPLPLPPVGADAATASGFPAVRLLLDRAAGFTLTGRNVEPVVRVCRALDGMPLAIELAAARLRTVPVSVLADRLADRFRLLTGGSRTALPRHQTLRAVVDWSWDLLGEPERRLWRRFAVFHGGAEVTGAEQVCEADLDLLGALVDKSLLILGPDGRYRMLETIREYGLERLAAAGETESQRVALSGYLLALASEAEPRLRSGDQLVWLHRLAAEHDNLHYAVRAAVDAGDRATAAALVARLGWYWWLRGHRAEGTALSGEVAAMPGVAASEDLALCYTFAALNGLEGGLSIDEVKAAFFRAEEFAEGAESRHPALRLLRPLMAFFDAESMEIDFGVVEPLYDDPDGWLRAVALMIVAQLRLNFGQSPDVADAGMREALAGFREIGDRWGIGFALSGLSDMAAARGDFAQAVRWQRDGLALVAELGAREEMPQMQAKLAHQLWLAGEEAEAQRTIKQARESAEEIGSPDVLASVEYVNATFARTAGDLASARHRMAQVAATIDHRTSVMQFRALVRHVQGMIEAAAGDVDLAGEHHLAALRLAVESRDSPVIALTLVGVADLALRRGDPRRAASLLGSSDSVRGSLDRSVPDIERITFEARAALGDAGFEAAYHRGDGVTMVTALAASGLDPTAEGPDRGRSEDDQQDARPDQ